MTVSRRLRSWLGSAVVLALLLTWVGQPRATSAESSAEVSAVVAPWTGGVSLYRQGTFTTQRSWLWCTAAGVQIVRNIVRRTEDHSTSNQRRYFAWMRDHNRYALPVSAGVDPAGWAAGLRRFVDGRYQLVSSRTFDEALRSAVKRLRQTNLPVAITVSHGGHGWILTGFRATADPARTSSFKVTSVRVVGPLYGRQSRNGYDMPPNTKLTPTQLKRFFTAWKYAPRKMIWDGHYVSIQPIPKTAPTVASAAKPRALTPPPTAIATPSPAMTPLATPVARPVATPAATESAPAPVAVAPLAVIATPTPTGSSTSGVAPALSREREEAGVGAAGLVMAGLAVLVAVVVLTSRVRRRAPTT